MRDWNTLTVEALRDLRADAAMVPGAKLRQRMVELGLEDGFDVAAYVKGSTHSFSGLVNQAEGVVVQLRPGSDVLVGLHGAQAPQDEPLLEARAGGLRKDVYQSFTRLSAVPFVYLPGSDRFVPENEAQGGAIAIEAVTLDGLIGDRRDFVEELPPNDRQPLLDALNGSTNPLAEFRREAVNRGVFHRWAAWQTQATEARVKDWARRNNLEPRRAWFRHTRTADSPQRTLARLAPYLTADEIRDLRIPFRAVEALLSDLKER